MCDERAAVALAYGGEGAGQRDWKLVSLDKGRIAGGSFMTRSATALLGSAPVKERESEQAQALIPTRPS